MYPYEIDFFCLDLPWLLVFLLLSCSFLLLLSSTYSFNFSISLELLTLLGTTSPHSTVISVFVQCGTT